MTVPSLPTELLIKIFSIVSSPSDLYHSLQASKQLADVVRPFLYHHITIETQQQRESLKNVREVDKKLVRKVAIKGGGPITVEDMGERSQSYRGGEGCVEELFAGDLLDISVIETLHVINVHYHLCETHKYNTYLPAQKLVELSILQQHGGVSFWKGLLARSDRFPLLHGLVLFDVTSYFHSQRYLVALTSKDKASAITRLRRRKEPIHLEGVYPRLHVLGSDELQCTLESFLALQVQHLRLLPLSLSIYRIGNALMNSSKVRFHLDLPGLRFDPSLVFRLLSSIRDHNRRVAFVSIPHPRPALPVELESVLAYLEQHGTEVHCDEEEEEDLDSTSLIPQHFVDYVERMKRLKLEEEAEEVG